MTRSDHWFLVLLIVISPTLDETGRIIGQLVASAFLLLSLINEWNEERNRD